MSSRDRSPINPRRRQSADMSSATGRRQSSSSSSRVDLRAVSADVQRCLQSVFAKDELRAKNSSLLAELRLMNSWLQTHVRGRTEDRRGLDPEEQDELRRRLSTIVRQLQEHSRLSQENDELRRALQQREQELTQVQEQREELRRALQQREQELRRFIQQQNECKRFLKQRKKFRQALHQREEELRGSLQQQHELRQRLKTSCERCEQQALEHRHTMLEMEAFYKDKLTEARSALKEKEEQLRSFKDRVAQNVVLSLKTENTENMNSPVNQSRLTEMYQQLRVCTWPNMLFSSSDGQAAALVQEAFGNAAKHVDDLRTSLNKLCDLRRSPKVDKFRQTALENLQLALLHSSKEAVFKAVFPRFHGGPSELHLASECFWLGCLLELHSPPLRPHWDSADAESVFPGDVVRHSS